MRAGLELVQGVPAASVVMGAETQHRRLGHPAEVPRPCARGQGPSWGSLGEGAGASLSPGTVSALGRAVSEAQAELIHGEERWRDVQQFRHGVHEGV